MKNALFVSENSKSYAKTNEHFYRCRRENRPHVVIRPKRKFASVEIDMFTTNRNLDQQTADAICKVLIEHSEPTAQVWRSLISCRVERVRKEVAEAVASRVYEIASAAMPGLRPIC